MTGGWGSLGAQEADFYLSPKGSDSWSGRLEAPNEKGSDGPFRTLERARDAVRELKKTKAGDIQVLLREGEYPLRETVVFSLEDSGTEKGTITYASYPDEKPVFTSGEEIQNWKRVEGELPGLPDKAEGKVWEADVSGHFFTLYDEEGLLPRARSAGFIPIAQEKKKKGKGKSAQEAKESREEKKKRESKESRDGKTHLHCPSGILRNWKNLEDVEVVIRPNHAWILNILPLASVDVEKGVATTSLEASYAMSPLHFLKTTESCWIENVLEELDEAGEWVLNTQTGKVYCWRRSESPVVVPRLIEFIRVEGEVDFEGPEDVPVTNLSFRGLTFTHGERYSMAKDDAGLQHDWDFLDKGNALVRFRGTEECVIEDCHFHNSSSAAIRVDLHGQRNKIQGNHIEQMGGAGIVLCGYGPGTKDVNLKNLVYNNDIHHVGLVYWHSAGILISQSGENRVANNLVHHTPYTGMILTGCITRFFKSGGRELGRTLRRHEIGKLPKEPEIEDVRPFLHSHDNLLEYNEIHHAMETMGDGNAFYIRGAGGGNVFRRNYVHHLVAPMIMQCGIRTDGGQRDTLFAENVIYKCTSQGIMMKLNTRVENNFVVDVIAPPRGYYLALREGPLTGGTIKKNILYSSGTECVFLDERGLGARANSEDRRGRSHARSQDAETDLNIYYCAAEPALGEATLQKQQQKGVDSESRAVDPLFVDPEKGDFRFQKDSPALEMGILPIDLSKVGLRKTAQNRTDSKP